jgi:outer membrane protein OmpA-like peptidoglycan-associated protein
MMIRLTGLLGACGLLASCAGTATTIALLPAEDGRDVGALAILDEASDDAVVLDQVGISKAGSKVQANLKAEIPARYVELAKSPPQPPARFILYFIPDSLQLAPGSEGMLDALILNFNKRPGASLQVIANTDTVGSSDFNLALSQKRAEEIAALLVTLGIPPDSISAIGRGESELRFQTPDETENAGNRRVEIIVY